MSLDNGTSGAEAVLGEAPGRGLRGELAVGLLGERLPRLGSRLLFAGQARLDLLRNVPVLISSISMFGAFARSYPK
jgi:hypothetical protein